MIINNEGKLFGKISIVDFAVVLCIVIAAAAIGVKFIFPKSIGKNIKTCEYTITIQNIREESVEAIKESIGQSWYDVNKVEVGKIKEIISISPFEGNVYKNDGTVIRAEQPGRYKMEIRMEGTAAKGNCAAMLGGKREVMHGSHLTVASKEIACEVLVTDIEFKE